MPNFQTHWVVAWEALKGLPGPAAAGRDLYEKEGQTCAKSLRDVVRSVKTKDEAGSLRRDFADALNRWRAALHKSDDTLHKVTCFSAFMLGAVGPDFWMVPSDNGHWWDGATARAANYFNLGHYNRTHQQFRRSVAAIGNGKSAQCDLERSYFCGMATHIAADLFIHQFVNLTAGAYNLLEEDVWSNEHGSSSLSLWNLHNKVEQYLDSYLRYRFLGDLAEVEAVFGDRELDWFTGSGPGGFTPAGFPLVETLIAIAKGMKDVDEKVRKATLGVLEDDDTRIQVERPLIFPALFCDRVLDAGMGAPVPFIYRRVVSRELGAYPKTEVAEKLLAKATDTQMESRRGGFSEEKKLRFFSSAMNEGTPMGKAWNYLVYYVSPNLDRIRQRSEKGLINGLDRFYDLSAMAHFGSRAVDLAKRFATEVQGAYSGGDSAALPTVGRFWNLDTGLGLEVQGIPSDTTHEVITRLDFLHVLDERVQRRSGLPYSRSGDPAKVRHLTGKQPHPDDHSAVSHRAFPVVSPPRRFASINEVAEPDTNAFPDRIRVGPQRTSCAPQLLSESLDEFFADTPKAWVRAHDVETQSFRARSELVLQDVKHRLTIELRIAIPDFGQTTDEPAMFFYCDEALGIDDAAKNETAKWIEKTAELVDFAAGPRAAGPLRQFTARILTNLETGKEEPRLVEPGKWNNVVPWKPNKRFYGRNFAVGTGRRFVLRSGMTGTGAPLFPDPPWPQKTTPDSNLFYFDRPFATEQVFLTLYPLVRTPDGKVYDAFSKERVERKKFDDQIRKIEGVGWVKVVLLYVLDPSGAAQLDKCFVDGLETPVGWNDSE